MKPLAADTPLSPGVTLVEASAGTGKTWNIAHLFVRLVVCEGLDVDQVLVVTFTHAAAAELRDRLRARIGEACTVLEAAATGQPPDDPAWEMLLDGDVARRLERARAARQSFDLASITTIHGFCQQVLRNHALETGAPLHLELIEDVRPVLEEIVDDHLTRLLGGVSPTTGQWYVQACGMRRKELLQLARTVTGAADAQLLPEQGISWDSWWEAVEEVRRGWKETAEELEAAMMLALTGPKEARRLDGRRYRARELDQVFATAREWLFGEALPPRGMGSSGWSQKLSARYARGPGQKAKAPAFEHPLMEAWDRLLDLAPGLLDAPRRAFADEVRASLESRLTRAGKVSFDGLLQVVARAVSRPGSDLPAALQAQYRAALIDEFQDTDAQQWRIFQAVFAADPMAHLFLIGDPKQAIYGFRGADVFVYRDAARRTPDDRRYTLAVNHRSDGAYVAALHALFRDPEQVFDLDFVRYEAVDYAQQRKPWRATEQPPLELRWIDGRLAGGERDGLLTKDQARRGVPARVAQDIADALAAGGRIEVDGQDRPLRPGDLAVLVRTNRQAQEIQEALRDRGVPAIQAGSGTVLDTPSAEAIERWLLALAEPSSERASRALAVTPWFGWTAKAIEAEQAAWDAFRERVRTWRERFDQRGFSVAFQDALHHGWGLLQTHDAERRLTDLRHLGELLQGAVADGHQSPDALLDWLRTAREEGGDRDALALRVESDADAVTVVTVHKSKGLQYGWVYLPYAWDGALLASSERDRLRVHPVAEDDARPLCIDLRQDPDPEMLAIAEREALQENLRLLYVALTRARQRAVVYWGPVTSRRGADLPHAALAIPLHGRGEGGTSQVERARSRVASALASHPAHLRRDLEDLEAEAAEPSRFMRDAGPGPLVAVTEAERPVLHPWKPPALERPDLQAATWTRGDLGGPWGRHSFSALARGGEAPSPHLHTPVTDPAVPLSDLVAGKVVGNALHQLLELLDFPTATEHLSPHRDVHDLTQVVAPAHGLRNPDDHQLIAQAIPRILDSPLGPGGGGICLRDLAWADRLNELAFDLPLAGGDHHAFEQPPVDGRAVGAWLEHPSLPEAWRGRERVLPPLAGFLNGVVDLVYRVQGPSGPTWYLCDYKSHRLGPAWEPSRGGHYQGAWLDQEVRKGDYDLQLVLYLVALHRLLGARLPDYDYERHVGGASILFLRGMVGPDTPVREGAVQGIVSVRPALEVIEGLSNLLEGGGP